MNRGITMMPIFSKKFFDQQITTLIMIFLIGGCNHDSSTPVTFNLMNMEMGGGTNTSNVDETQCEDTCQFISRCSEFAQCNEDMIQRSTQKKKRQKKKRQN